MLMVAEKSWPSQSQVSIHQCFLRSALPGVGYVLLCGPLDLRLSHSCPLMGWTELRHLSRDTHVYAETQKTVANSREEEKTSEAVTMGQQSPITILWHETLRNLRVLSTKPACCVVRQWTGPGRKIMLIFYYKVIAWFKTSEFTYPLEYVTLDIPLCLGPCKSYSGPE